MKQTIFNASLEESMNLVTDQYIKTSFEAFKEKGYEGKISGFITKQSILFLIFLLSIWIDSQNLQFLFMKVSLINGVLFGLGFVGFAAYLIDLTKIKNQSILSYYYFKKNLEAYRQLADYSIEDWCGKESKRYKESLDQEV